MTVFVGYEGQQKTKEMYHVTNVKHSDGHVVAPSQGNPEEDEEISASRTFWIRLTWIYLAVFCLTICVIGTIAYGYGLTKRNLSTCTSSADITEILLRIEELERKINIFENSVPIVAGDEVKV